MRNMIYLPKAPLTLTFGLLSSGPALACGSCAMDAGLLHIPFLPTWFYLFCGFFVAATAIRITTKTLNLGRAVQSIVALVVGFMSAAAMLGPLVLFLFLLGWFVRYIGHVRDKTAKDPASPLMAKLGHVFLVGLIISGITGIAHDKFVGVESKLARGNGGTTTVAFCRDIAKDKSIPLDRLMELAKSDDARLRCNAQLVLAYSREKSTIPLLIESLEKDGRPTRFQSDIMSSLRAQTDVSISNASEWKEWLKDPEAVEARVALEEAEKAKAKARKASHP